MELGLTLAHGVHVHTHVKLDTGQGSAIAPIPSQLLMEIPAQALQKLCRNATSNLACKVRTTLQKAFGDISKANDEIQKNHI